MLDQLQKIYDDVTGTTGNALSPKTKLKELQLSSLGLVQLICAIEDEFEIEISNADLRSFKTVKNVIDYLEKTLN